MASFGVVEDCDGVFIEGGPAGFDEADYARAIINLIVTSDIPPRYFQNRIFSPHSQDMSSFQKINQPASRYRLLHREWGKSMSGTVEGAGIMALLTLDDLTLDENRALSIARAVNHMVKCQFLRWDQQCVLLYLASTLEYKQLGELFLDGKLDNFEGSRVMQLEAATLTNPPRSLLEVYVPKDQGAMARGITSSFLSSFSGAFTHAVIMEDENVSTTAIPSDAVPSLGAVLFFTPRTQSLALQAQAALSALPWKEKPLPEEVSNVEFCTKLFVHSEQALPFWGVRTGAPDSGVRLLLLVQDPSKFDAMNEFYQQFTGVTALENKSASSALRCSTYTLSSRCEFMLAHYPGLKPYTLDSLAIGFHIRNLNKAAGAERLNDDHWMTRDPEGNRVALFSVRR